MARHPKATFVLAFIVLAVAGQARAEAVQADAAVRPGTLRPDADESLQWSASVVELNALSNQGDVSAKLFGTAGGDPAMNGLHTYLAFYASPAEGWSVFRLGDFLSYRILSEAPGRVAIEVEESVMDEASGQIGSRTRRFDVTWTAGPDGVPPAAVTVTPAS